MSERTSCELPEGGPQSLVQLSSQRQRRPNDSEQNVYLPLTTFLDQPISPPATFAANENSQLYIPATNENSTRQVRQFTPDFPEEPPPAYNDLFPDGFQQLNESQELATADTSSNALQRSNACLSTINHVIRIFVYDVINYVYITLLADCFRRTVQKEFY